MTQAGSVEELWQESHGKLLAYIRARVPCLEDAEDLLQEVFIRVQAHLPTLRDGGRRNGWLFQVTRNVIADHYRHLGRSVLKPEASEDRADPTEDAADRSPDHPAESPSFRLGRGLRCMVADLPEPYRQALQLTEMEGLSQVQAAERLGLSISGMKSRVQRGRQLLRELLLQCCEVELDRRGSVIDYHRRRPCDPDRCG